MDDFFTELKHEIRALKILRENDVVEFHYRLRGYVKKSYLHNLKYLEDLVSYFGYEIIPNGIFYIDVINDSISYFFAQNQKKNQLVMNSIVHLLDYISDICDRQSLEMIDFFIKKISPSLRTQKEKLSEIYKKVYNNIQNIDEKIKNYKLSPKKEIIINWY